MSAVITENGVYYCLVTYALFSSISIAASNIFVSLALLLAIISFFLKPYKIKADIGLVRRIGLFFFAVAVSAIFAHNSGNGFFYLFNTVYRILPLFLVATFVKTKKQMGVILAAMVISIVLADGYAIWQGVRGSIRATGFSAHPMIFAGYLIQMIPLMIVLFAEGSFNSSRNRWCLVIAVIFSIIALILNNTRGAWLAVTGVSIIYGLLCLRKNPRIFMTIICVGVIVSIAIVSVPYLSERANSITNTSYSSNAERLLIWQSAWQMFLDYPLTGVGFGNYMDQYQHNYISPLAKERTLGHAHNNFLQILAETGLFGLLTFLLMFGYILVTSFRQYRRYGNVMMLAAFLVTLSFLVQGLTEYNFGDSAVIRMYWFLLGLTFSGINIQGAGKNPPMPVTSILKQSSEQEITQQPKY